MLRTTAPAAMIELGVAVDAHPAHPDQPSLPRRLKITRKMLKQHGTTNGCPQCEHIRAFSEHKAGVQHSEKCRARIAESLAATADGADRIARSKLRIDRGIEAASRHDQPRGGELVRIVADLAAEVPHTQTWLGHTHVTPVWRTREALRPFTEQAWTCTTLGEAENQCKMMRPLLAWSQPHVRPPREGRTMGVRRSPRVLQA